MKLRWKPGTILHVEFLDICTNSNWLPKSIATKRPPSEDIDARYVGFFNKIDKELMYLSSMVLGKDGQRDQTVIPLGCIKKVRRIGL